MAPNVASSIGFPTQFVNGVDQPSETGRLRERGRVLEVRRGS